MKMTKFFQMKKKMKKNYQTQECNKKSKKKITNF